MKSKVIKRKSFSYYLVLDKRDNYNHGAFPYSKKGLEMARAYIAKLTPTSKFKISRR